MHFLGIAFARSRLRLQRRPTYKVSFFGGGRVPLDLRCRVPLEAKPFVRELTPPGPREGSSILNAHLVVMSAAVRGLSCEPVHVSLQDACKLFVLFSRESLKFFYFFRGQIPCPRVHSVSTRLEIYSKSAIDGQDPR